MFSALSFQTLLYASKGKCVCHQLFSWHSYITLIMSKHSSSKLGMLVLNSLVFTKWRVFRRQLSKLSNLVVLAACGGAAHMAVAAAAANSRRDGGSKKNKDSSPA